MPSFVRKLLKKSFNLQNRAEVVKIGQSWVLRFLLKTGIILGWTTLIALFISRFSLEKLPLFLLIQAVLVIAGMLAFSFFVQESNVRKLMCFSTFGSALLLFIASFFSANNFLFFTLTLIGYSMFASQISIFLSNFIEDRFSPLEMERANPLIESAETVGGIIGGVLLSFISGPKVLYVWIVLLLLFLFAFLSYYSRSKAHHHLSRKKRVLFSNTPNAFISTLEQIKKVPFLQILLIVFFLQWIFLNILEFQFTKVVEEGSRNALTVEAHETSISHSLGLLHIILHASALVVQLFVASKITQKLGTFGGFLVHAFVTFLSVLSLLFGFGYFTAVMARNNFEITTIIQRNSYEGSYYAFKHGTQRSLREFFEAFICPLAGIAATLVLSFIQYFFLEQHYALVTGLVLLLCASLMMFFSFHLQKNYTHMVQQLLESVHHHVRLHGIQILSQRGHRHGYKILMQHLHKKHPVDIKIKIIRALATIGNPKAVGTLIGYRYHPNRQIRKAVIEALNTLQYNETAG